MPITQQPRRLVAYPPRPAAKARFGYNVQAVPADNAHVDLAVAGGATLLRDQYAWNSVETYQVGGGGALALGSAGEAFLARCAFHGVQPILVAGYAPPWVTLGSLVTTVDVPIHSPAGTPIPVSAYGFTIDYPHCAAGGSFATPVGLTARESYWGSIITSATSSAITLGQETQIDLPAGTHISIQRLAYAPPATSADPSITAFLRYVSFLAARIAANGCTGFVSIWNEWPWLGDWWDSLAWQYDTIPSGVTMYPGSDAGTYGMNPMLIGAQGLALPAGVKIINDTSDLSGFAGTVVQTRSTPVPLTGNIAFDSLHPYADNPEGTAWDYYGWGFSPADLLVLPAHFVNPDPTGQVNWWEAVNPGVDAGSNGRYMGFADDLVPNAPGIMATECGTSSASDLTQTIYLLRRVVSLWGLGIIPVLYVLDDGTAPGSNTPAVAPSSTPRQAYTALQRLIATIAAMAPDTDGYGALGAPSVIGAPSDLWPIMSTTIVGERGHSVTFLWQRTHSESSGWTSIASPAPVNAEVSLPGAVSVASCVNLVTGAAVTATVAGDVITVPVTDEVVALRLSP